MNNGDKPVQAMAMNVAENTCLTGYTKREDIAKACMQGLLSSYGQHDVTDFEEMAYDAVNAADALLRALEGNHE